MKTFYVTPGEDGEYMNTKLETRNAKKVGAGALANILENVFVVD